MTAQPNLITTTNSNKQNHAYRKTPAKQKPSNQNEALHTDSIPQWASLLIAKHNLNLRLRQTVKHYHKIVKKLNPQKNALNVQQLESLRLYEEMINSIKNIALLIDHHRTSDLDTLLRKVIEHYVFIRVIETDEKQAQSLHLKAGISLCKRRSYVEPNGLLTSEQALPSNVNRMKQLDVKYKTAFAEGANPDRWFNLNGKTTCMEKLIEMYKIDTKFAILYMILSLDVHAVKSTLTTKQLKNIELEDLYEGEPEGYILETLMTVLNDSDCIMKKLCAVEIQIK